MTETVSIRALVDPAASIGAGCVLGPMAVVEAGAVLGAGCVLEPFARVCAGTVLGDRVRMGQGAVVGGIPQHASWNGEPSPCVLGDDVRLGEYATVHGGFFGITRVDSGALLMAYAHVGHDCQVGQGAILANAVQLAGHVQIGERVNIGGGTLVHQRVRVGALAFVAGGLRVERDVAPWSRILGEPARWAGINRTGMLRNGWTAERIAAADECLRVLFRRGLRLEEALERMGTMASDEAAALTDFCRENGRGLIRPHH